MVRQHYSVRSRTFWANDDNPVLTLNQDGTGPSLSLLHATQPEIRSAEEDQVDPVGRWRWITNGDVHKLQRATLAAWAAVEDWITCDKAGATITFLYQVSFPGGVVYPDDVLLKLGTHGDQVLLNRSTILAANTALANVLIGVPVSQAIAANSLMISNVTASGDIAMYVNMAGASQQVLLAQGATGIVFLPKATLTSPTINGTVATTGLTMPAFILAGNITLGADRNIIGDFILQPNVDGQVSLGQTSNRFKLVRAVTITSGDFIFENGYRLVEAERLGLPVGIALVRPDSSIAEVFN
jgi:hypothetical protein